jgi:hypothetical protein
MSDPTGTTEPDIYKRFMEAAKWGVQPGPFPVAGSLLVEAARKIERLREKLQVEEADRYAGWYQE